MHVVRMHCCLAVMVPCMRTKVLVLVSLLIASLGIELVSLLVAFIGLLADGVIIGDFVKDEALEPTGTSQG
jgi:hypothetical protein